MSTGIDPSIMTLITAAAQKQGTNIATKTGDLTGQTSGDVFSWNQPNQATSQGQYGTLAMNLGANAIGGQLPTPKFTSSTPQSMQALSTGQQGIQTGLAGYNPLTPASMQGIPSSITSHVLGTSSYGQPISGLPSVPNSISAANINPIGSTWQGQSSIGPGGPQTAGGINMQPYAQSILDYFNQGTLPPQLQAIQNQMQTSQQQEMQQLEQSLAVRGLNQSTLGDAERQQLAAAHRDQLTTAMTQAANSMLSTQANVLGQLSSSQLASQGQAFNQGLQAQQQGAANQGQLFGQGMQTNAAQQAAQQQAYQQALATQQQAAAEQNQLFGQGITQRGTALNELTTLGGSQEQLLNDAFTQAMAANQQGYAQGLGMAGLQTGVAYDLFSQTQSARQSSLNEFLSLLNAQQGLDTSSFNQSNAAVAQLLQAMGLTATPANVPGFTVPYNAQTSTSQAGGNLLGNMATAALSNPNFFKF